MRTPNIATALDAPRESLDAAELEVVDNIARYGFHVMNIQTTEADALAQPEWRDVPDWTYSIGLYVSFGHPEIVIFSLPPESANAVLQDIADQARDGRELALGAIYDGELRSFPGQRFALETVASEWSESLFGWACWFYGASTDFPVAQYLWPDSAGRFAWEDGVGEHICQAQRKLDIAPIRAKQPPPPRC